MEAAGRSMFRHEEQKMAVPKSIVGENLIRLIFYSAVIRFLDLLSREPERNPKTP